MVTGIDLVKEQIRIASGMPLSFKQPDIKLNGHSFECRINAEDPEKFTPCPGQITKYSAPGGLGIRVDSAMEPNATVVPYYDSLIAKLITHGRDRQGAMARMRRALDEFVIEGIKTTIPLHRKILTIRISKACLHDVPRPLPRRTVVLVDRRGQEHATHHAIHQQLLTGLYFVLDPSVRPDRPLVDVSAWPPHWACVSSNIATNRHP